MAITIFAIHITIIIDEIFISGIVRGIYINDINFPLVCVSKCCESFEIVSFDD